jgi:hydrogenase maturation protease
MSNKYKIAVLGIGNPLCRDDGIGIRIIQEMRDSGKYENIALIDGGAAPDLLSLIDEDVERLIIVDALKGGGPPGSIYLLEIKDENIADDIVASLHGLGIMDSLLMMKKLDMHRPQVTIVGVEPQDVSHGLGLSSELIAVLPAVFDAVAEEIHPKH